MTENKFYADAARYWAKIPPTVDGILGGFGNISGVDLEGSRHFLHKIFNMPNPPGKELALDCGAGIGRVTCGLLAQHFNTIDLVEQDTKFLNMAIEMVDKNKLGMAYRGGLQDFEPSRQYDVIWCQWVLGHLTDFDMVDFLKRCKGALKENGVIVVKENITDSDFLDYDDEDSSVTRPLKLMYIIFHDADLHVSFDEVQLGFPDSIYPVYMFALKPANGSACPCANNIVIT